MNQFAAHASHSSLGTEAIPGKLVFDRWRLRFESGAAKLEIPLSRLLIELDDSESGGIYFRDPDQPDLEIYTGDARVLQQRELLQDSQTRSQIKAFQSRGDLRRSLVITLWVLAGFTAIALSVWVLTGIMVRSLVARIPVETEQKVGDALMAELSKEVTFLQDPKLLARLDRGVAPLVDALPKTGIKYQFYIMDEPLPNAFALPGGYVIVTTGLLDLAARPEELAGAVAHEIAHVTRKHLFRKIISAAGPYVIFGVFLSGGGGILGMLGDTSELLVSQSFSQKYELEADDVGWDYLVSAHIDPRGLTDMLTKLEAEQGKQGMNGADEALHAFSSHPATAKRIHRLEAKWKKLKNKSDFVPLGEKQPRQ